MKKSKTTKSKLSSNAISRPADEPTKEKIAVAAYILWQQAGCPEGRDVQHWLTAEAQLHQSRAEARS
jgi:hypothetical protein